mgnify:CR=1 FL=1
MTNAKKIKKYLDLGMWANIIQDDETEHLIIGIKEGHEAFIGSMGETLNYAWVDKHTISITPIPRKLVILDNGQMVRVGGLVEDTMINGLRGVIHSFDKDRLRYLVDLENGKMGFIPHYTAIPVFEETPFDQMSGVTPSMRGEVKEIHQLTGDFSFRRELREIVEDMLHKQIEIIDVLNTLRK